MTKDCNFRLITGPIKRPKNWASNILHTSKEAKRSIQNKTGVNPDETFRKNWFKKLQEFCLILSKKYVAWIL